MPGETLEKPGSQQKSIRTERLLAALEDLPSVNGKNVFEKKKSWKIVGVLSTQEENFSSSLNRLQFHGKKSFLFNIYYMKRKIRLQKHNLQLVNFILSFISFKVSCTKKIKFFTKNA